MNHTVQTRQKLAPPRRNGGRAGIYKDLSHGDSALHFRLSTGGHKRLPSSALNDAGEVQVQGYGEVPCLGDERSATSGPAPKYFSRRRVYSRALQ